MEYNNFVSLFLLCEHIILILFHFSYIDNIIESIRIETFALRKQKRLHLIVVIIVYDLKCVNSNYSLIKQTLARKTCDIFQSFSFKFEFQLFISIQFDTSLFAGKILMLKSYLALHAPPKFHGKTFESLKSSIQPKFT